MGQIIGEAFEVAVEPPIRRFAEEHQLYLDWKHERPARNNKKRVEWADAHGNVHQLDHVLERGGSETLVGVPVAFIETAWRRYSKHARNKAQEIQGAVVPIREAWANASPFAGAVLAGEFTEASLQQLRSHGFEVLYVPYSTIVGVFARHGIDVAYDVGTSDQVVDSAIANYRALSAETKRAIGHDLRGAIAAELDAFIGALGAAVLRRVGRVSLAVLHGISDHFEDVSAAIAAVENYAGPGDGLPLVRFEVAVLYDNGDRVEASFQHAADAISFLQSYG